MMKIKEIQKKFGNKFAVRVLTGVLTAALLAGSYGMGYMRGVQPDEQISVVAAEKSQIEEKINELVSQASKPDDTTKDETVYVIADANGNTGKIIVEDWLKNVDGAATIKDQSDLENIANVKGDETFSQDGQQLIWQADGKDIYYEGTTDKELPVTEAVTYYLDGQEVTPAELAGKSGKVTIRFDYENHEKTKVATDSGDIEVYVPFTVITGMILPDSFTNIQVTNGKVVSDGKNNIVVGMAMPGLHESLQKDVSEFDSDVKFPDYVEMTADVENFELQMTASIAMTGLLSDLNLADMDLDGLENSIDTLSEASGDLESGSKSLADGLGTLNDSMAEFTKGAGDLSAGIKSYTEAATKIDQGLAALNKGTGTLTQGASALDSSAKTISAGVQKLDQALNKEMTKKEQQAAKQAVAAQFAKGTDTYQYIYGSATKQFGKTMTSEATVQQIQAGITGMGLTDEGVIKALAQYYAANGFIDATTGTKYTPAQCQATVPGTDTVYAAYFAKTVLSSGLAKGIAGGIAQSGAAAVGENVVSACRSAAETAAVQGAENAKKTIAGQIEAVDEASGYSLVTGSSALSSGISTLAASVPDLVTGVSQLKIGADQLVANNQKLTSGAKNLSDGASQIAEGVSKLDDGAGQLYDGMVQFNEEGISKLVDAFNGDAKDLLSRVDAIIQAGENYTTFTGLSDEQIGSVKFIIKTDTIKAE